jgi:hypothetical protein
VAVEGVEEGAGLVVVQVQVHRQPRVLHVTCPTSGSLA